MTLVIVESPTKAKTIQKFLPKEYTVLSSYGHIRDLPRSKMGIDIEHGFTPQYVIPKDSQKQVTVLKKAAAKAKTIILATDEDREGEAIAWHLTQALELGQGTEKRKDQRTKEPRSERTVQRIVFHEITKEAIEEALKSPRDIDEKLVDAQQARRVLDRLVGYELSPLLWKKVARGLSAGRVQSVALRLIVDREREIEAFKSQEYWTIETMLASSSVIPSHAEGSRSFTAELTALNNKKLEKFDIANQARAKEIISALDTATYAVESVEKKKTSKSPYPPFTTSTLQQDANRRLGFGASQTMRVAQDLYEAGLISYMRTDSVNLAGKFLSETQSYLKNALAARYATGVKTYKTKSKGAQEAHEAIRPTEVQRTPELAAKELSDPRQVKLYDLIWRRAVASQMPEAELDSTSVRVKSTATKESRIAEATFSATGSMLVFDGFLAVYPMELKTTILPELVQGQKLAAQSVTPKQHFTEPPARYSDATLVKALEEHGIGRPSTYAPTISTLVTRRYVERIESRRLRPTDIGLLVAGLLLEHFPSIVDPEFTARMEEGLDGVAEGNRVWGPLISEFYHPFHELIETKTEELSKKTLTEEKTDEVCEKCGKPMVIKMGRYGKFVACSGFPECRNTKRIETPGAPGQPASDTGVLCPKCSKGNIVRRRSKRGRFFFGCSAYPNCDFVLWNPPAKDEQGKLKTCDKCASPMVLGPKDAEKCSNKECVNFKAKSAGSTEPTASF